MKKRPAYPFRHAPAAVDAETVQRLGYDPAEIVIERVRRLGETASLPVIERWLEHPDERVLLAAIEHAPNQLRMKLGAQVRRRFQAITDRDGPVWSPVRDRIDSVMIQDRVAFEKLAAPWFRQAAADEVLEALQPYTSEAPFWAAAKEVRDWTPQLVTLIVSNAPRAVARLGRNRHLSDPQCIATLLEHLLAAAEDSKRSTLPWGYDEGAMLLFRRLDTADEALIARTLDVIKNSKRAIAAAFARALGSLPSFDDALGHRVLAVMDGRHDVAAAMIEGKRCSVEIAKLALRTAPRLAVRRAIAKRPEFLSDPAIRADLKTSDCARVKRALISTATPEEAGPMVERLTVTNMSRALEVMEEVMPQGTAVSVDTMARLLDAEGSTMRERAMRILSSVSLQPGEAQESERRGPSR